MHSVFIDYFDESHRESLVRQTPNCSARWKNIELVDDITQADYQIALNKVAQNPGHVRTLLFSLEPPCLNPEERWEKYDVHRKYPITDLHYPHVWNLDRSYDELKHVNELEKSKDLTWVVTDKGRRTNPRWFSLLKWYRDYLIGIGYRKYRYKSLPLAKRILGRDTGASEYIFKANNFLLNYPTDGHIQRMKFMERLRQEYPKVDLYGWGSWEPDEPCYQGVVDHLWDGLSEYRYALAVENSNERNWFTDKVADALLAWCMPIFWGCPNLNDFLPEDSYVTIDIEDENAPKRVREIVESDLREQNLDAIKRARELILDEFQFWPTVHRKIRTLEADGSGPD